MGARKRRWLASERSNTHGFNEASPMGARKQFQRGPTQGTGVGFNEASPMGARKPGLSRYAAMPVSRLQ